LLAQKTLQVSCSFLNVYEKIVKKRDYFTAKLFLTGIAVLWVSLGLNP